MNAKYSIRLDRDQIAVGDLTDLDACDVFAAEPRRTFHWHRGQRHYPGRHWCATTGGFVGYESRLELAVLLLEDFDPRVVRIASQPFELVADRDGRPGSHVPDYMVEYDDRSYAVVDVKPARRLERPDIADALRWAGDVVEARGWEYRIATEPEAVLLSNVRFLSGYRRAALFLAHDVQAAMDASQDALTIGQAVRLAGSVLRDTAYARAVVLHLLWCHVLRCDLSIPLANDTELEFS